MGPKKTKLMLYSTLVEVQVGVELGKNCVWLNFLFPVRHDKGDIIFVLVKPIFAYLRN